MTGISRGYCTPSLIAVSDGYRLWMLDDSVCTFRRDDMVELSRYDFPEPSSYSEFVAVCE